MSHPKVSFILLAYKQEEYVRAAVEGALAQDYPALEILISDDCSPDRTFEIMQDTIRGYQGPHRVSASQTPRNLGLGPHLQRVVERAEGELLILAAGDDVSAPQRTKRVVEAWLKAGGGPAMLYSDYRALSLAGDVLAERSPVICKTPPSFADACRGELDVHGGSSAITPSLFRDFRHLSPDVVHEDRVLPFRALLLGGSVIYIDEPLVDYRVHGGISRMPLNSGLADEFRLRSEERKVADASQRLADLLEKQPSNVKSVRACHSTIREHQCRITFARSPQRHYELQLIRHLGSGARIGKILRIYLRHRLNSLKKLIGSHGSNQQ